MADILAEIRQMVGTDSLGERKSSAPVAPRAPVDVAAPIKPVTAGPPGASTTDDLSDLLEPASGSRQVPKSAPDFKQPPSAPLKDLPKEWPSAGPLKPMPADLKTPAPTNAAVEPAAPSPAAPFPPSMAAAMIPAAPSPTVPMEAPKAAPAMAPTPTAPPAAAPPSPEAARALPLGRPLGASVPPPLTTPDTRGPLSMGSIDALIGALRPPHGAAPVAALKPTGSTVATTVDAQKPAEVPAQGRPPLDPSLDHVLGALAAGLASRGVGASRVGPTPAPVSGPPAEPTPAPSAPVPVESVPIVTATPRPAPPEQADVEPIPRSHFSVSAPVGGDPKPSPSDAARPHPASPTQATPDLPAVPDTLDDRMAELLRPMLRQWLDTNLPRIVEKALRVELAAGVASSRPVANGASATGQTPRRAEPQASAPQGTARQ
jgi:hypothetical protein